MPERIGRRQALQRLGAPALVPLVLHLHPALPPQEGEWKPRVFRESELDTVAALAERIIPETDTPGARGALVHQYIDFVLSEGEAAVRERFREGLAWLDGRSAALHGQPFARLTPARQDALLTRLSEGASDEERAGAAFFAEAKRLTVDGYYRSEVGMKQELGFDGRTFLAEFEGCTHPEHHDWKVGE
jgi:Gluconate 2-dehydrogenase subunit 3